ncbi:MAG: sigma-54-dependent transcriptional regulator [Gemmatimonadales bacterium]
MTDSILIVHDDPTVLRSVGARFEETGNEVIRELSVETGVGTLARIRPDAVLLATGLASAEAIAELGAGGVGVVLFGSGLSPADQVAGLSAGATQVIDTAADGSVLIPVAAQVAAGTRMRRVAERALAETAPRHGLELLGSSASMKQLAQQIGLLAQSDRTTLMLTGETGAGKAWAARVIHGLGGRARKPFFEVRLSGANPAYLESLLFGHEVGVFVEATERRRGLLELAEGGTVLLREIGDLPEEIQPKLLRVLETRAFRRMGGGDDITVDTRLMVTTRRSLAKDVEAGSFREDLFYRLNVMTLEIPAFRERAAEDRELVIKQVHEDVTRLYPDGPQAISVEAMDRLQAYAWPGNVREVFNVLDRSMLMARGQVTINVEHLPGEFRARAGLGDRRHTPMTLDSLEHQHIEKTLRFHGGNRTRAAKELGISRATLINKIKLYAIAD